MANLRSEGWDETRTGTGPAVEFIAKPSFNRTFIPVLVPAVFILLSLARPLQSSGNAQAPPSLDQASELRQAGRLSEARDMYEQVLKTDPANAAAQNGDVEVSERMALDARADGHMDEALKDLLQAQKLVPENPR